MRIELLQPDGAVARALSGVLRVAANGAEWTVLLPSSAMPGHWMIRVTDSLSGQSVARPLVVDPLSEAGNAAR